MLVLEAKFCGFDSHLGHHFIAGLTQMVECLLYTQNVGGSIPSSRTILALGTAWCGRSPVTRDIQMGSLPIRVAILEGKAERICRCLLNRWFLRECVSSTLPSANRVNHVVYHYW